MKSFSIRLFGDREVSGFRVRLRWEGWTSEYDTEEPVKAVDQRDVGHLEIVRSRDSV